MNEMVFDSGVIVDLGERMMLEGARQSCASAHDCLHSLFMICSVATLFLKLNPLFVNL